MRGKMKLKMIFLSTAKKKNLLARLRWRSFHRINFFVRGPRETLQPTSFHCLQQQRLTGQRTNTQGASSSLMLWLPKYNELRGGHRVGSTCKIDIGGFERKNKSDVTINFCHIKKLINIPKKERVKIQTHGPDYRIYYPVTK